MQSSSAARRADFLIIGGGIAAASVGHWLAPHGLTILLERESQPGYHSTGRSAALFMESYGTPQVRALTLASRAFFDAPPQGFAEHPLLTPRGALMVAEPGQEAELEDGGRCCAASPHDARRLDADSACALMPVLRRERIAGAVYEPDAADMDVHAIHQGYLRGLKRAGGSVVCDAEVTALRREGGLWQVQAGGQLYEAPVVLNAAGAWADVVAQLAGVRRIGLQPRRRAAFIFAPPRAWTSTPGRWRSASARTGTSSPTPACCSARRPTPIRWNRTTCSPKSSTSRWPSTASRR